MNFLRRTLVAAGILAATAAAPIKSQTPQTPPGIEQMAQDSRIVMQEIVTAQHSLNQTPSNYVEARDHYLAARNNVSHANDMNNEDKQDLTTMLNYKISFLEYMINISGQTAKLLDNLPTPDTLNANHLRLMNELTHSLISLVDSVDNWGGIKNQMNSANRATYEDSTVARIMSILGTVSGWQSLAELHPQALVQQLRAVLAEYERQLSGPIDQRITNRDPNLTTAIGQLLQRAIEQVEYIIRYAQEQPNTGNPATLS